MKCALAVFVLLSASLAPAAVSGAKVLGVEVDAHNSTATIHLLNTSSKDISAYVLSFDAIYGNGRVDHSEILVDLLPLMMTRVNQIPGASLGDGSLRSAEARDEVENLAAETRNPLTRADATVIAVVYVDRTADAQSGTALERVLALRRGIALARNESADVINKATMNRGEAHPSAVAADGIRKIVLRSKADHTGESVTELLSIVDDMLRAPSEALGLGISERDYLTRYARESAVRGSTALTHAQVRREP
jgi:nucleoside 2-deoxyribosyltransferase